MMPRMLSWSRIAPRFNRGVVRSVSSESNKRVSLSSHLPEPPPLAPETLAPRSETRPPSLRAGPRAWLKARIDATKTEASLYKKGLSNLSENSVHSGRLLMEAMQGRAVSRRDKLLVGRTALDMIRLLPLAAIVALPGGSMLLPFVFKFVPASLPYPVRVALDPSFLPVASQRHRTLTVEDRQEMAKGLRSAVETMAVQLQLQHSGDWVPAADSVASMLGSEVSSKDSSVVIEFFRIQQSRWLPSFSREQVTTMLIACGLTAPKYMPTLLLKRRLRKHTRYLASDDLLLQQGGISELLPDELRTACAERGLCAHLTGDRLGDEGAKEADKKRAAALHWWLELSVDKHVPVLLIVYGQTFCSLEPLDSN